MIRAILIEDNLAIQKKNKNLITENCSSINIIATAESVKEAVRLIKELKPDLIFLDIELQGGSGFDILKEFQNDIFFKIIFITSYEEFAIKAFRYSAIDFLSKPLVTEGLIESVKKAEESFSNDQGKVQLITLLHNVSAKNSDKKIVLKNVNKIYSININEIIRCESFNNYTTFYTLTGDSYTASNTLKHYEKILSPYSFFRPHQSHIINLNFFDCYIKGDNSVLVLKNKERIPISDAKKNEFMTILESSSIS